MKYFIFHTLCLIPLSIFISRVDSCSPKSNSTATQNLASVYKDQDILHPKFAVFHKSSTTSELYFKINSKELLYHKLPEGEKFAANISLHYNLISTYETKDIIDSATVNLADYYSPSPKDIVGKVSVNAALTNNYRLEIIFSDMNRNVSMKTVVDVNKLNFFSRQNFLITSSDNKTPLFRDYIEKNERVNIRHRTSDVTLYVRFYHREFPLPTPPFSTANMTPFEYRADSLFTIQLNEKDTVGLLFNRQGFYHIQTDTSTTEGVTLFKFYEDFPYVKTPDLLLQPLRFITSRQEYEAMASYKNHKAAVDSFWVYTGGNKDRAKELIKKFYNRIQSSNMYFSSYTEGWKTDRGLVYLVYGPPNVVYKNLDSENWVYGQENNFNSLTFNFLKVVNPFTDNDYRLDRSPLFKNGWFNAVEMWRQGKVYSEK